MLVLGCKVNQAEAAAISRLLEDHGYAIVDNGAVDLVLIHTCCVTARAEGKSRRAVRQAASRNPNARILVTGCFAEINPDSLTDLTAPRNILGTARKDRLAHDVSKLLAGAEECSDNEIPPISGFGDLGAAVISGRARSFLKIQDGCSQHCTYCIVPKARGPSRSLAPNKVIQYAGDLAQAGTREIVLTGVHVGRYGLDLESGLALEDLLSRLLDACPNVRFRISSIEPPEITDRLIHMMSADPRICRHLHVPLQSADNAVLKRMARPYRAESVEMLVRKAVEAIPDVCIGMDVMVGFPGEDEDAYRRTVGFIESIRPAYLHVFPFSPRPGTPAARFVPRVPHDTAQRRVDELRRLSQSLRLDFYGRFIGRTVPAVSESEPHEHSQSLIARSDNYLKLRIPWNRSQNVPAVFSARITEVNEEEAVAEIIE